MRPQYKSKHPKKQSRLENPGYSEESENHYQDAYFCSQINTYLAEAQKAYNDHQENPFRDAIANLFNLFNSAAKAKESIPYPFQPFYETNFFPIIIDTVTVLKNPDILFPSFSILVNLTSTYQYCRELCDVPLLFFEKVPIFELLEQNEKFMRPLVVTLTNFDAFIEFNHNITPEIFQHIESHIYRAVDKDLTEAILKFIKSVTLNHNIDLNFAQNILPPLRHVIPNNDYQDVNEEYCVIVLECLINLIKKDSLHLNTFLSLKFTDFLKRRIDDQRFTRHILIFIGLYTQKFPQSMLSLGISIDSIYKHICVEDSSFDAALWCFYYIIESDHILLESENTMKIIDYLFEKFDGNGYFVKRYIVLLIALVYKHIPTSEYDKDKVIKILDMFTEVAEMGTDEERREMFKYLVQTVCSIYRVYENCPKEEIDDQFMQCLATLISGAEDLGENELCETLNKMMQECTDE